MSIAVLLVLVALVLLYFGAEWLVKGSSLLALKFGVSPLVVGLTVVAFGTSTPELLVSLNAALNNSPDISIGNVVGSNIFNACFILGIAALISPMLVQKQVLKVDSPISIFLAGITFWLFIDGVLGRLEGLFLFVLLVAYIFYHIVMAKRDKSQVNELDIDLADVQHTSFQKCVILIAGGLTTLVLGSDVLVDNCVFIAREFGVSEAVIGLTIVAAGTSTPELATSVFAALKKEADIAIGNIIGSNIFNIACILGLSSLITPLRTSGITYVDLTVMFLSGIILHIFLTTKLTLERWEGGALLILFSGYMIYLWP